MKIGNIEIKSRIFLARSKGPYPIAFRLLCKKYGAGAISTHPLIAKDIIKNGLNLNMYLGNEPLFCHIFGSEPDEIAKAAKIIDDNPHGQVIALNFADANDVMHKIKCGSYCLQFPEKIGEAVKKTKAVVKKPVIVVMRLGYKDYNYMKVAEEIVKNGADGIVFHARRGLDEYTDPANWLAVKEVKEYAKIPVIVRGDIDSPETVKKVLLQTKADGAMFGREALGNPYIFMQANQYLVTGIKPPNPNLKRKKEIFFEFYELYKKVGEVIEYTYFKEQAAYFFMHLPDEKIIIAKIDKCKDEDELIKYLKTL